MASAAYEGHSSKRLKTNQDRSYNPYITSPSGNSRYNNHHRHEEPANNILLMTVLNPTYPITCDVIHQISTAHGKVLRIVIFKKNGLQSMVEFDSVESAKQAKLALNGCDIYSGCCTLRVEYAKPTRLNVYKNDHESFDYTNLTLGSKMPVTDSRPALLNDPTNHYGHPDIYVAARGIPAYGLTPDCYGQQDAYRETGSGGQHGSVLMIYGLNAQAMNCDKLFNLLCQYGNVMRIKFLKSKEGCVMVQMGDSVSVERAISSLNKLQVYDGEIQLSFSKQSFLNDVKQPFELSDGTPSFKDYMGNRNNRFTNPDSASKNRNPLPTNVLHFFNAPYGITEAEISKLLEENCASSRPQNVSFFPSKTERSSSGLITFESVQQAFETLIQCNHVQIPNPNGKFPFVFKLCFSLTANRY